MQQGPSAEAIRGFGLGFVVGPLATSSSPGRGAAPVTNYPCGRARKGRPRPETPVLIPVVCGRLITFNMPNHFYDPVRKCIYCGTDTLPEGFQRFTDEHIFAFGLGGNLVLQEASCRCCQRKINTQQPIFDAIEAIALHWESYSLSCSNTIRTARSRTSGEYLFGLPMMTPILSSNGVSGKPGEVHPLGNVFTVGRTPYQRAFSGSPTNTSLLLAWAETWSCKRQAVGVANVKSTNRSKLQFFGTSGEDYVTV